MPAHDRSTPRRKSLLRVVLGRKLLFARLGRRRRWLIRLLVALPLGLVLLWVLVARSPLTGMLLMGPLSSATNLDIRADLVVIRADGRLVASDADVRIPGVPGPAGLLMHVDSLEADVDWWATLSGKPTVREVRLVEPMLRVSQSVADGSLNVGSIVLPKDEVSDGAIRLPTIVATSGAVELGEHRGESYTLLKRISVEGVLAPVRTDQGTPGYTVRMHQLPAWPRTGPAAADDARDGGFRIEGMIDPDGGVRLVLNDFSLDEWADPTIPTRIRELAKELDLRGEVDRATLTYSKADGVAAELTLDDVAVKLPIEAQVEGPPAPTPRYMRMHSVDGVIRFTSGGAAAKLNGLVEDLPYQVTLTYDGLSAEAPFTLEFVSRGFKVQENPQLLPYAPGTVRRRLAQFSSPTMTMNTRVVVKRGAPVDGQPGLVTLDGTIEVANGAAAYEKFPYPVVDLEGVIKFNNEQIDIVRVTGRSESGATVEATGRIWPPGPGAEAELDITIRNAPLDETMERAFTGKRRKILTALFSQERYAELVDRGLVLDSRREAELRAELGREEQTLAKMGEADGGRSAAMARIAGIRRALAVPRFEVGGMADVQVHLHRPRGEDVEWENTIDIRLRRAHLVPEHFPLPIVAKDVRILVENDHAEVRGGTYRGLTGGEAVIEADALLEDASGRKIPVRPDVRIVAQGVPGDELLINAIPGTDGEDGESFSTRRMLRDLKISGTVGGTAHILPRGETDLGFDIDVRLNDLTASPADPAGHERVRLSNLDGSLQISEERLTMDLAADAAPPGGGAPSSAARIAGSLAVRFPDKDAGRGADLDGSFRSEAFDVALPIEDVVRTISAAAGEQIASLRATYRPEGVGNAQAALALRDGELSDLRIAAERLRGAALDLFGGRVALGPAAGRLVAVVEPDAAVTFEALGAPLTFDGLPAGRTELSGQWAIPRGTEPAPREGMLPLTIELSDGRFESALVRNILAERLSRDAFAEYQSYRPRGDFDATIVIEPPPADPTLPPRPAHGQVRPRTLALDARGTRVEFGSVEGTVEFEGDTGVLRQLTARAPHWSATLEGAWHGEENATVLRTKLDLQAASLTTDLRAMLPAELDAVLDGLAFGVAGPLRLQDGMLAITRSPDPARRGAEFSGVLSYQDAGLDVGVLITEASGRAGLVYEQHGDEPASYRIDVAADTLAAADVSASDARASVRSGTRRGEVLVTSLTADVHGGRFAGQARSVVGPDGRRDYLVEARLSGVSYRPLLDDLPPAPGQPPVPPVSREIAAEMALAKLDAELTLAGLAGVPESRRGRGSIHVAGGRVLHLPLAMRLVEVSNLQLPANDPLDYASADFYIDGVTAIFDEIGIFSDAVSIVGYGTMTWPEKVLDLRFDSSSARRIPILSDLVEGIRNELVTTSVTGRLGEHEVRLVQFPGARRILGRAVGAREDEQARRLEQIGRLAQEGRGRTARPVEGIRPTPDPGQPKELKPSNARNTSSPTGSSSTRP